MNKNARKAKVYTEDTICRLSDNVLGVVLRTWHDIEQPDYGETLESGQYEVDWYNAFGAFGLLEEHAEEDISVDILHEDLPGYVVVDRSFGTSDAVKKDSASPMSGIVQGGSTIIKIRNLATREIRECIGTDVVVPAEQWQTGNYVVSGQWVGIVDGTLPKSLVRFNDGTMAICRRNRVESRQYEEGSIYFPEILPCTALVDVERTELKYTANYLSGRYTKGMSRHGVVCVTTNSNLVIHWQFQNMMNPVFQRTEEPRVSQIIEGNSCCKPAKLIDGQFSHQIGDIVRLNDFADTTAKFEDFRDVDIEQAKRACIDWEVISTKQKVVIKWQDGSTEEFLASELVPAENVDDLELWPSDNVLSKSTGHKGIVQSCDAKERTAIVKWTTTADGARLPPSEPQLESLYELMNDADLNLDLGDLVLIGPEDGLVAKVGVDDLRMKLNPMQPPSKPAEDETMQTDCHTDLDDTEITWIGQLISIDTDGMCDVLLCFTDDPSVIKVDISRLVHLSPTGRHQGDDDTSMSDDESVLSISSTDSMSSAYDSVSKGEQDRGTWQDENGQVIDSQNEGDEWEDGSDMNGSSEDEVINVVGEDITEPELADIVLDVSPETDAFMTDNFMQAKGATDVVEDRSAEISEAAIPVTVQADSFPRSATEFAPFLILDIEPTDHNFAQEPLNRSAEAMKRVAQEYKSLQSSLPSGILVRAYESRMDLLRVVILGVSGTPYVYAPMLFDIYLPMAYPYEPPHVHFHSWTNGVGKINPNLYEEGKVCLSLLGTWHGSRSESWTVKSSLLQIFVSLQALVLVKEPYYNEAGYEVLSASDTAVASNNYSERAYVLTRGFIVHVLRNPVAGLEAELQWLYRGPGDFLARATQQAEAVEAASTRDDAALDDTAAVTRISKGALVLLHRTIQQLHSLSS